MWMGYPCARSPIGVPVSVVVTQKVILAHHLVSGNFQGLVNRRQEIFTQTGDLAERDNREKGHSSYSSNSGPGSRLACSACQNSVCLFLSTYAQRQPCPSKKTWSCVVVEHDFHSRPFQTRCGFNYLTTRVVCEYEDVCAAYWSLVDKIPAQVLRRRQTLQIHRNVKNSKNNGALENSRRLPWPGGVSSSFQASGQVLPGCS